MNFLQLLKAKTEKLITTEVVKLSCIESEKFGCTLVKTGVIVPQSEIIKIENGFVYISGANAYNYSRQEALSQIKL